MTNHYDQFNDSVWAALDAAHQGIQADIDELKAQASQLDELASCLSSKGRPLDATKARSAATKARSAATKAKAAANSGDATEATRIAAEANRELWEAIRNLDTRLSAWGFTAPDEDGRISPAKGSWAEWVTTSVDSHQVTLHGNDGQSGLVADVAKLRSEVDGLNANAGRKVGEDGKVVFASNGSSDGFNNLWAIIAFLVVMIGTIIFGQQALGVFAAILLGLGLGAGAAWIVGAFLGRRSQ